MQNATKGLRLAFLASIVSGVSIFVNKFAVASLPDPVLLPMVKNSIVGIVFSFFLLDKNLRQELRKLNKKQTLQLFLVGFVGGFMPFYLFFTGLSQIPAVNANIIHKTMILWLALLAPFLLNEKISKLQAFAVLGLFASNLVPGGFRGLIYSKGELFVLLATLMWTMEVIIVKKLTSSIDPKLIAIFRMGLGSFLLLLSVGIKNPNNLTLILNFTFNQWFWIVLTSLTLSVYVYFWYHALKLLPALKVSAILVTSTIITNILSAIFVTKTWGLNLSLQLTIILTAIAVFIFTPTLSKVQHPK